MSQKKHPALQKHRTTDKFKGFCPGVAAFRDERAFAAAHQRHRAEIRKAAIENHSLHPWLPKNDLNSPNPALPGTGHALPHIRAPLAPGPAHQARLSSPRPGAPFPIPARLPQPARAQNPPKTRTHIAVKEFFLGLRFVIFCLNFLRHGAHPARPGERKKKNPKKIKPTVVHTVLYSDQVRAGATPLADEVGYYFAI